ncbi:MAG: PAS domain S-box protein [Gemmatimonadetes bacterium]|nr:PAS domain S-box protein [Gemmatimonadota bacterium]
MRYPCGVNIARERDLPRWADDPIGSRHRRQVLQQVLLALIVLFALNAVVRLAMDPAYQVPWPAYGVLLAALLANARGYVTIASVITVLLPPAFLAAAFLTASPQRHPVVLAYMLVDVLLASILLGGTATVAMGALNIGVLLLLNAVSPVVHDSGVVNAMFLLFVMTTILMVFGLRMRARLEAERDAALVESNTRMSVMLESAMDAIITLDTRGHVADVNPAALRIFGYTREQMVGHDMADLIIPGAFRARHREGLAVVAATGISNLAGQRLELRALRADGTSFPCELTFAIAQLGSGMMFTGFVRDLSEREAASARAAALEEQLRQSQKMEAIGQLAGGVAHEFNNMLQVITGFLSLAVEDLKAKAPEAVNDLTQATDAAMRASDLTRRLLAFSRRQVLNLEVVNFNEALSASLTLIRRTLAEQIELEFHPGAFLPTVRLDRSQLEQVVLNLCLNARDAMPDGGRLILETEVVDVPESFVADHPWAQPGTYVALVVADSGAGMEPEVAAHIFEPFFTTKGLRGGSGLGLAVVYGIVEQHRGFIRVDTAPGEGTSFRVYWPVSGEEATPRPTRDYEVVTGGTETLLVAEDADAIRELITRAATNAGYRVISARDGREASARLAEHRDEIDMVVLDMVMPRLSGRGALEEMRRLRPDLPCLFLSGYSAAEVTEEWLRAHHCRLMLKPVTPQALLRAIRATLDNRVRTT